MFASALTPATVRPTAPTTRTSVRTTSSIRVIATPAPRTSTTSRARASAVAPLAALAKQPPASNDGVWDPLGLARRGGGVLEDEGEDWFAKTFAANARTPTTRAMGTRSSPGDGGNMGDFFSGKLPGKIATVFALLVVSRVGTYIPISGVDRAAFAESLAGGGGMMGYVDTLTGGSISKLGIFSLGIVPYINSSIIFQLLGSVFPEFKKLQKEEGESGRRQFQQYQRCV